MRRVAMALLLGVAGSSACAADDPAAAARAFAENWLRSQYATAGHRVVAKAAPIDRHLTLTPCPAALSASLLEGSRLAPRMNVIVRCPLEGGWTARVGVDMQVYRQVLVTARPLQRGDGIRPDDVRSEERDITRLGYGYVSGLDEVAGRSLSRALVPGAVLTPAAFGGRTAIRAGDQVQLISRVDGIEVRAGGIALGGGDTGARVRVRNGSSGRVLDGTVQGPGEVLALP